MNCVQSCAISHWNLLKQKLVYSSTAVIKCRYFADCRHGGAEIRAVFEERGGRHRQRRCVWMSNTRRTCSSDHVVSAALLSVYAALMYSKELTLTWYIADVSSVILMYATRWWNESNDFVCLLAFRMWLLTCVQEPRRKDVGREW